MNNTEKYSIYIYYWFHLRPLLTSPPLKLGTFAFLLAVMKSFSLSLFGILTHTLSIHVI